ncbi:hypothetical protein SPBRAN_1128 [uncultured Candidatus Thioglobus sp.]|nr:hypothetical protein SPBRAN_1128 [uncultured Candidatus Thioglobus sp.]
MNSLEQSTMETKMEYPINTTGITEAVVKNFRHGINIGEQNLLFDKNILCEVALNTEIHPIPNMPRWLHGVINLRGNLVPVFEINTFLTENVQRNKKNIIFVINKGANAIGLLIDKLPVTLEIDETNEILLNTYEEKTPEIFSGCINKIYALNTDVWLEIDMQILIDNIHNRSLIKKT